MDGPRDAVTRPRPGGRSARVQMAVHEAVRALQSELEAADITVPAIAARAGVTPSTIYRRWGSLAQLLADVAVRNLRPDSDPEDAGSLAGDLIRWLEGYIEEMSSEPGRAMIRDVLGAGMPSNAGRCSAYICDQLSLILERAAGRGERVPDVQVLMDRLVAPVMYRILFTATPPGPEQAAPMVRTLLAETQNSPQANERQGDTHG